MTKKVKKLAGDADLGIGGHPSQVARRTGGAHLAAQEAGKFFKIDKPFRPADAPARALVPRTPAITISGVGGAVRMSIPDIAHRTENSSFVPILAFQQAIL